MKELFDLRPRDQDQPMERSELIASMKSCDVLVPCINDTIDNAMLSQAGPNLRLIANFAAGFDNIDVATALQKNILVSNTPGVVTEDTADMAMALILGVTRRIPEGLNVMKEGRWSGWAPDAFLGGRISGRRLGILGMGRIGRALADRANAFGMQVHYHNRKRLRPELEEQHKATYWESLDQMLTHMHIISINCPHTPATFQLRSESRLKLVKPHAYIVNTSRGEVIDEKALTRMLASGDIAGAGLDVFEHELAINPNLLNLENVVLLPHMGSATLEGRLDMGEKVIVNIKTFADGHTPPDRVLETMF